jgi:hypothetical protein
VLCTENCVDGDKAKVSMELDVQNSNVSFSFGSEEIRSGGLFGR